MTVEGAGMTVEGAGMTVNMTTRPRDGAIFQMGASLLRRRGQDIAAGADGAGGNALSFRAFRRSRRTGCAGAAGQ